MLTKKNCFEFIYKSLNNFKNSEIPADRLFYINSIKELVEIGEKLNKLNPNAETQEGVQHLKKEIEDYKLYPKLD